MESFIDQVVQKLIEQKEQFHRTRIILPGKRPEVFFQRAFKKHLSNHMLPEFLTIQELMAEISDLQLIDPITLWRILYESHLKTSTQPQTFDEFLKWAPVLLKDFEEIDVSLQDAPAIFEYLISDERIKLWAQNDEFEPNRHQLIQYEFSFWEECKALYETFQSELLSHQIAYQGLIFKKANESLESFIQQDENQYVFVGFNALTQVEKNLFSAMKINQKASFFWDADRYYLEDELQEAGVSLREHKTQWQEDFTWINDYLSHQKNIKIHGISGHVAQAKYVAEILKTIPPEEIPDTAIALADEGLLFPVLNSIPDHVQAINITMGLPLKEIPAAHFYHSILNLHQRLEQSERKEFYFKDILNVLFFSEFQSFWQEEATRFKQEIQRKNWLFISPQQVMELIGNHPIAQLFRPENPSVIIEEILNLNAFLEKQESMDGIQKEYLFQLTKIFRQLGHELQQMNWSMDFKSIAQIFNTLMKSESLNFRGEPLQGLQIMGILETRLLDFKNIIITSMNEGVIPSGSMENSLIPYDIKKLFKLKTYTDQDAVFAYHFYRLIQRPEKIHLLYNSSKDAFEHAEPSRFIQQLQFDFIHSPEEENVVVQPDIQQLTPIEIPKNPEILERIQAWKEKGVSASALNSYVRNPIQFFEQKILKIQESEEMEDMLAANKLGNWVHKVLEELYRPLIDTELNDSLLENLKKNIAPTMKKCLMAEMGIEKFNRGKNVLIQEVAYQMVRNVIENDIETVKQNSLIIRALEVKKEVVYQFETLGAVKLHGIIDRVDEVNGMLRLVDYKTGKVDENKLRVKDAHMEKLTEQPEYSIVLQLLFYALLSQENSYQLMVWPLQKIDGEPVALSWNGENSLNQNHHELVVPVVEEILLEIENPEVAFMEKG